ncbi:hypothetical protein CPB86DRAFT_821090 [Serendipita vermifera]|nr:hypothetical protein CPB86DRAFT_821090 [Serendipita vermifera]
MATTTSHRKLGNLQPDSSHILFIKEALSRRTRPLNAIEEGHRFSIQHPLAQLTGVRPSRQFSSSAKSDSSASLRKRTVPFEDHVASLALVQGDCPGAPNWTWTRSRAGIITNRTPTPDCPVVRCLHPFHCSICSTFSASTSRYHEPTSAPARTSAYHSAINSSSSSSSGQGQVSLVKSAHLVSSLKALRAHIPSYTSPPQLAPHYRPLHRILRNA